MGGEAGSGRARAPVAVLFPLVVSVAITWRLSTWLPPAEGTLERAGLWLA